ncbi:hypothetical protein [Hyalangium rubrum]|uniref:Uncharacterized protein n=1 Tax=Hyalangium rubrum TaxID=3103134 RepID=A0ABU5H366_9BACT|nr:hypothetical protein [Hyalangium sp. s54d21]MDY7227716.1 hypothetical protein [Hyalangium sp. s54d21]
MGAQKLGQESVALPLARSAREEFWDSGHEPRSRFERAELLLEKVRHVQRRASDLLQQGKDRLARRFARTAYDSVAERFLRQQQVEKAMNFWWGHAPRIRPQTEQRVLSAMKSGWESRLLEGQVHRVHFHQEQNIRVEPVDEGFVCKLWGLGCSGHGGAPREAMDDAALRIQRETQRLNQEMTHRLSGEERKRKRLLLGAVDIVRSGVLEEVPRTTWVFGRIETREKGRASFRALEEGGGTFRLPRRLIPRPCTESFHFAEVRAGPAGEPIGPVVSLEEVASSPERPSEEKESVTVPAMPLEQE